MKNTLIALAVAGVFAVGGAPLLGLDPAEMFQFILAQFGGAAV